jgi:hypothetical protein
MNVTEMTKTERQAAASKEFMQADEYDPEAMVLHLMHKYNLSVEEVNFAITQPRSTTKSAKNLGPCHYCGLPATKYGSFDVPVCDDCQ